MWRRRHLNIRGKSANLPAITERDWLDIKFGVDVGVDYYALSFVRNADVIYELKRWLSQQGEAPFLWPATTLSQPVKKAAGVQCSASTTHFTDPQWGPLLCVGYNSLPDTVSFQG